jgi:thiol-disulfide isomerase/thioredoxin
MKILIIIISLLFYNASFAQNAYKTNDFVKDIVAKKIINYSTTSSSLKNLKGKITILDFFGTWCVPCIKALPELKTYKNKFKDDVNVVLISTEAETKLNTFISTRKPFDFPIIVDEDNLFTSAFMPPSYPFTIVLDKNLKVLAITNAADLSDEILKKFIQGQKNNVEEKKITYPTDTIKKVTTKMSTSISKENKIVQLSQDFVYAAKTNENVATFITKLKELDYDTLLNNLQTDDERKAFWINLYNAYTNSSLHQNPNQYESRNKFFKAKNIIVAGKVFSLDKIEHGILRRSKIKWSLGYLNKLFPNKVEKKLRVDRLDNRIHFALNCGAKSCPPIAFYKSSTIDNQLDAATNAFLTSEVKFEKEQNTVELPILLSWFRRDFGGKKRIISMLKKMQLIPENVQPKITFKKYDWTLYLDNFKNINEQ